MSPDEYSELFRETLGHAPISITDWAKLAGIFAGKAVAHKDEILGLRARIAELEVEHVKNLDIIMGNKHVRCG